MELNFLRDSLASLQMEKEPENKFWALVTKM